MSFFPVLSLEGWHGWHMGTRFDLFLYLPMNRMFVTIGTEFSQLQSTRCIVSILLSNISGNAPWFFINTVSDTTGTFQNNCYSGIFTLGHEPPLDFWFTQLFYFRYETKKKKETKKKYKLLTRNQIMKDFVAINRVIINNK